jgi:hypothetical protein
MLEIRSYDFTGRQLILFMIMTNKYGMKTLLLYRN